ncbi:MAG: type II secretion system F family protein [Marinobacterium sp.]|nr:type II secretion system F family protein [Marinobacterium sp.]
MPLFETRALNDDGTLQQVHVEASSEQAALQQLEAEGKIPLSATLLRSVTPEQHGSKQRALLHSWLRRRKSAEQIEDFIRELACLLQAGIALEHALKLLQQNGLQSGTSSSVLPLHNILQMLRDGQTFSEALACYPDLFDPLCISLVQAGEASGDLAEGLESLHQYQQQSRKLKTMLGNALIYPAILALVAVASILIILLTVIPQFADLLDGAQHQLPSHTQLILQLSAILQAHGQWLALALAASLLLLQYSLRWLQTPLGRLLLRIPILGPLRRDAELARFNRCLGTLLCRGLPLLQALQLARQTLQLAPLQHLFTHCSEQLRAGQPLAPLLIQPKDSSLHIPPLMHQLVSIGEETGQLGPMLQKLASIQLEQTEQQLKRLVSLLEPLLIISLGLVIALLVLSMLSAIISVNNLSF